MSQTPHTYGPTCHLARTVSFSGSKGDDDMPPLKPQFFYSSALPIDDPLSAAPAYAVSEAWGAGYPPRPFSTGDNNALEEAWLALGSDKDRKNHNKSKSLKSGWKRRAEKHNNTADVHSAKSNKKGGSEGDIKASPAAAAVVIPLNITSSGLSHQRVYPEESKGLVGLSSSQASSGMEDKQTIAKKSKIPDTIGGAADGADDETEQEFSEQAVRNQTIQREFDSDVGSNNTNHCGPTSTLPWHTTSGSQTESRRNSREEITHLGKSEDYASKDQGPLEDSEVKIQAADKELSNGQNSRLAKYSSLDQDLDRAQGDAANDGYLRKMVRKSSQQKPGQGPKLGREASELDGRRLGECENNNPLNSKDPHNSEMVAGSPMSGLTNLPAQDREAGISGSPFAKLPSHEDNPLSSTPIASTLDKHENQLPLSSDSTDFPARSRRVQERDSTETETLPHHGCKADKNTSKHVEVPVGISRLHLVKLPILQMEPIYWSPVHDICAVTRGTWFYRDTMCPVEPGVANQLEIGYRELRPWSGTWNDELNSAIEVGAIGEEKISHRLWQEDDKDSTATSVTDSILSTNPHCAARCFHGEAAAEGSVVAEEPDKSSNTKTITKKYPNSHVIYKDSRNAFILKPSLQPSAYYGRRPLQKIRKGTTVGIHVVRGFDWNAREKIHPSKKPKVITKAEENAPVAGDAQAIKGDFCVACLSPEVRPNVTDLILVIHGIGQKLSERVESFHFTHAINSFRRSVNVELGNEAVQRVLRNNHGGIMVLPVNWRSDLSFEDGGPKRGDDEDHTDPFFSLKDITPNSIPAVRNLISDVMLDIPFYMSHHKPKMIQAVIKEANRVYRLWCRNNPDFHREGRVHIIAHSLGSAMAVEILSNQPTTTPKSDVNTRKINAKTFDFNTTNLFLVGSPAGFFLLLEKGHLTPRLGQNKPCAEYADDNDKGIGGSAGTYGCLAVDNIYNVMDLNDPIAYCLNATADTQYAASLKSAQVPSATTSFLESIGNAVKSLTPGISNPADTSISQGREPAPTGHLPPQLEMEVHDFTREEIAEKKFYLLNDNGQVDWFLSSGGGPLEIQYISMLGAHSSYWTNQDFVRMLVTEVGRRPGKHHTLPNMRAIKIGHKR
jgi:hypothetical protein